jgi:predicted nucleotidyltransferase
MLSTLLGSETRARVLIALLARPHREYHLRELIRLTGGGASGVQREVERLEGLGLITSQYTPAGRRVLRAVDEHRLLGPLEALVAAEAAADDPDRPREAGEQVHARLRPCLPALLTALRDAGVEHAVLFGSATETGAAETPRDVDVLVRLGGPAKGRAGRYFALRDALQRASGLPVDLVEDEAVDNPYLRAEIERTGVVLVAAA